MPLNKEANNAPGYFSFRIPFDKRYIRGKNRSGTVSFFSEEALYRWLEPWLRIILKTVSTQVEFSDSCIIDYRGMDFHGQTVLVEVKEWFPRCKDMQQIMKYMDHASAKYGINNFRFILICAGISEHRRSILEMLGVEIFLTKNMLEEDVTDIPII